MIPVFANLNFIQAAFMSKEATQLKNLPLSLKELVQVQQVHGDRVICIQQVKDLDEIFKQQADALICSLPQVAIAIRTADCVPMLVAHPQGVISAIHAGWRGSAQSILVKTLHLMQEKYLLDLKQIKLAIGPAICQNCYEVGIEVAQAFMDLGLETCLQKKSKEKFHLDLKTVNYLQALNLGLDKKNIWVSPDCSMCQNETYFSYRYSMKSGEKNSGRNYSWIRLS